MSSERFKTDTAMRSDWRQFGLITGSLFIVLLGCLLPWLRGHSYPVWPWVVGFFLIGAGAVCPAALKWPYVVWVAVGKFLGWINSRLILALLFYAIVTPMGLVMRLLGSDPMTRKFDPGAETYRVGSRRTSTQSLERPF